MKKRILSLVLAVAVILGVLTSVVFAINAPIDFTTTQPNQQTEPEPTPTPTPEPMPMEETVVEETDGEVTVGTVTPSVQYSTSANMPTIENIEFGIPENAQYDGLPYVSFNLVGGDPNIDYRVLAEFVATTDNNEVYSNSIETNGDTSRLKFFPDRKFNQEATSIMYNKVNLYVMEWEPEMGAKTEAELIAEYTGQIYPHNINLTATRTDSADKSFIRKTSETYVPPQGNNYRQCNFQIADLPLNATLTLYNPANNGVQFSGTGSTGVYNFNDLAFFSNDEFIWNLGLGNLTASPVNDLLVLNTYQTVADSNSSYTMSVTNYPLGYNWIDDMPDYEPTFTATNAELVLANPIDSTAEKHLYVTFDAEALPNANAESSYERVAIIETRKTDGSFSYNYEYIDYSSSTIIEGKKASYLDFEIDNLDYDRIRIAILPTSEYNFTPSSVMKWFKEDYFVEGKNEITVDINVNLTTETTPLLIKKNSQVYKDSYNLNAVDFILKGLNPGDFYFFDDGIPNIVNFVQSDGSVTISDRQFPDGSYPYNLGNATTPPANGTHEFHTFNTTAGTADADGVVPYAINITDYTLTYDLEYTADVVEYRATDIEFGLQADGYMKTLPYVTFNIE